MGCDGRGAAQRQPVGDPALLPAIRRCARALGRAQLASGLRRRVGADDVAQSACRTFLRRAQIGEFELSDSEGLWGLLCAITLTKVREQTRFHLREKRGLHREVHHAAGNAAGDSTGGPSVFFDRPTAEPSPDDAAEFTDQFTRLVESLDEEERQLVDLKLQQFTNDEIAERMGCSERTVRRILKRVQAVPDATFRRSRARAGQPGRLSSRVVGVGPQGVPGNAPVGCGEISRTGIPFSAAPVTPP